MADQKLTDLPSIATGDIDNSVLLYCVDVTGGNLSSKVTRSALYLDIANTFTKGQTISSVLLTGLVINPPTTPVGSASVTFIGGLNFTTGTIAFATTAQSTDYGSYRINQATLVNSPGAGVIPNAWSLKIDGPPIASTNVTISNNYSLWIASGGTYLQGTLTINTGSSPLVIYNPAGTFAYTITPAAIVASRQLNLPLTTATDTLATLGLAQTFSGAITSTGGIMMSSADITLAGNKIKTTSYNVYETSSNAGNPVLLFQASGTNAFADIMVAPSGTNRVSRFLVNRTSDISTDVEYGMFGSDYLTTGEFALVSTKANAGSLRPLNVYMAVTKLLSFDTANTITSYVSIINTGSANETLLRMANTGTGGKNWDIYSTGASSGLGQGNLSFYNQSDSKEYLRLGNSAIIAYYNIQPPSATGTASQSLALDIANNSLLTVTSGSTATPVGNANNFGGFFFITDTTTGQWALVATGGSSLTIIAQQGTEFVNSSSPTSSQTGLYLNSLVLTLKNGYAVSHDYQMMAFRTRGTN